FFFQAEDGIRDFHVTGVQTCALPIWVRLNSVSRVGEVIDWFTGSTSVASLRSDQVMPRRGASPDRLLGRTLWQITWQTILADYLDRKSVVRERGEQAELGLILSE